MLGSEICNQVSSGVNSYLFLSLQFNKVAFRHLAAKNLSNTKSTKDNNFVSAVMAFY